MTALRPIRASCFLSVLILTFAGCRNCEVLEIALRSREQDVQMLRSAVSQLEYENHALRQENNSLYHDGTWRLPPESAAQFYTMHRINLGSFTGGIDDDRKDGDEALRVIIEPQDKLGDTIKAPGQAKITALEISPEGLKSPLAVWQFSEHDLLKHWKKGLLSNGYVLKLPWQRPPQFENVRVIVLFELSDGRKFEADTDIKVRVNPHFSNPIPVAPSIQPFAEPPQELPTPKLQPIPEVNRVEPPILQPTANWRPNTSDIGIQLSRPIPLSESD